MFKFLKRILGEKQEEAAERRQISGFEEAEMLARERKQAVASKLQEKIKTAKSRLEHEKKTAREKIEQLRTAKLMNPHIPERAKHFADGNREAYIRKAEQFMEGIELPDKIEELQDFFNRFDSSIVELAESAAKPYQILQEFFANEANSVRGAIGAIEKAVVELKEAIKAANLAEWERLGNEIAELKKKIGQQGELARGLAGKQKAVEELERQKTQLGKELADAESDTGYLELKEKLRSAKESIKKIEDGILSSFAVLETALKKYSKVSFEHRETAENYLKSPVAALSQDFELRIADCLSRIKKLLEKDELDVKERKKERSLEEIAKLSREYLADVVKNYAAAKKSEQDALSSLGASEAFKKTRQLREKIGQLEQELARAKEEAERLRKKVGKPELEKAKQGIIEKVNGLL